MSGNPSRLRSPMLTLADVSAVVSSRSTRVKLGRSGARPVRSDEASAIAATIFFIRTPILPREAASEPFIPDSDHPAAPRPAATRDPGDTLRVVVVDQLFAFANRARRHDPDRAT